MSYPKSDPNYEGKGMRRLTRSHGDTLEAVMDFHEELSKDLGRNISYEFNEYHKARLFTPPPRPPWMTLPDP